jgi:flagellin
VDQALGNLGSQSKQIDSHMTFIAQLTDVLTTGVGNLVDADLAKESARLQALQVQQQLGAQALSIANSAPQVILQLFK